MLLDVRNWGVYMQAAKKKEHQQKAKTIFISFQISREFFHFHLKFISRCMVTTTIIHSLQQRPTLTAAGILKYICMYVQK